MRHFFICLFFMTFFFFNCFSYAEKVCTINVNYSAVKNCMFLLDAETCRNKGLELEYMTQDTYSCAWQHKLWSSCEIVGTGKNNMAECQNVSLEDCTKIEYCSVRGHD